MISRQFGGQTLQVRKVMPHTASNIALNGANGGRAGSPFAEHGDVRSTCPMAAQLIKPAQIIQ
jgi:hypothetical protein